uniref:G-protein coupled receptors family 3 profile domain-containing protein n=1 Tax=Minutocellus polymorphus TaxID=265543 RepID=A0A7S0ATN0_9STRA
MDCDCDSFVVTQTYWLGIGLASEGPSPNSGYKWGILKDIYNAANATNSDIIMFWYNPDPFLQSFHGTDYEFVPIVLPTPTQECIDNRATKEARCSSNLTEQYGLEVGACDSEQQNLKKAIVSNLYETTYKVDEELRSPAYDALKTFKMTELHIAEIFTNWYDRNIDRDNFDPREATCRWIAENIDTLKASIPRSYPREQRPSNSFEAGYLYAAMAVGVFVALLLVVTTLLTYSLRKTKVFRYAQIEFALMVLAGLFLVSLGSIVITIKPSLGSCTSLAWFLLVGYTLELIPVIVKVAAINKMMSAAKKMKRVELDRKKLYYVVFAITFFVVVFLVAWSAADPPREQPSFELGDEVNDQGGNVVSVTYSCGSNSDSWLYISIVWQALLLLVATVLAVQSRDVRSEFNESTQLGFLIYSSFFFVVIRTITLFLETSIASNKLACFRSFIFSSDTFVNVGIYYGPKFWEIYKGGEGASLSLGESIAPKSVVIGSVVRKLSGPLFGSSARRSSGFSSRSAGDDFDVSAEAEAGVGAEVGAKAEAEAAAAAEH